MHTDYGIGLVGFTCLQHTAEQYYLTNIEYSK